MHGLRLMIKEETMPLVSSLNFQRLQNLQNEDYSQSKHGIAIGHASA
jgi:hypothetical protein